MRLSLFSTIILFILAGFPLQAEELKVEMVLKFPDKKVETRFVPLTIQGNIQRLNVSASSIPDGIEQIEIHHPWATAQTGEEGFFVFPNGMYGTFKKNTDGEVVNPYTVMQMIGFKTPRGAVCAILTGLCYEANHCVSVKKGVYKIFPRYKLNGDKVYEDIGIDFHVLPSEKSTYADMARVYRQYQLNRGECVPLKERIKNNPELDYAAKSMEVRVRLGWKPVPSPVKEQTAETEPPMHVAISFDRFMQIVDEFKRQGVNRAEFCLVGWNIGGHDGRYPQIFPVDERLGGEAKLRQAIAKAQKEGFQIVCHTNYSDAYSVSHIGNCWDENFLLQKKDGKFNQYTTWGGGGMYETCPECMYKRFPDIDFPKIRDLGFKGLHYIDVYSTVNPRTCYAKDHPLTKRDFALWTNKIFDKAQKQFGGLGSEGGFDYCISHLDYALYISFFKPKNKTSRLFDRHVPIWQLVYNGIVLNNPFTETTNYTIKTPFDRLKLIEYGGRPMFYFYSKFKSSGSNWMGDADITSGTDEELKASVAKIKEGYDEFEKLKALQLEFMESHDQLAEGVFKTGFSNGTQIVCNYTEKEYVWKGQKVPSLGYIVVK